MAAPMMPIDGFSIEELPAFKLECEACGMSHVSWGAHVDLGLGVWAAEHYERCKGAQALALKRAEEKLQPPPEPR